MSQYLTRNPGQSRKSNTQGPGSASGRQPEPVQFYELAYTTTGAQEWIYLPDDTFPIGVCLSGSGSWVATIEATDSPPDVVDTGSPVTYTWPQGTQTATTAATTLAGATAVRANITTVGTYVKISVRS
jgi:hypothetical protein